MPDVDASPVVPALERCPRCSSLLVQPVSWRRVSPDRWELRLRCPDCGDRWLDEASTAAVRRLDEILVHGRRVLEGHLAAIEQIEHDQAVATFRTALEADAILPEDFGRP